MTLDATLVMFTFWIHILKSTLLGSGGQFTSNVTSEETVCRLLNALTVPLSVCRSLVFWENIARSEECFLPVSRALTHARTHTCTARPARERSEAHPPRQQHRSRTDILTRIAFTYQGSPSPMRFSHGDATPQLLGIYSALTFTFAIAVDSNQRARTSA